ncbi:DUF5906 domain-containing protein [Pontiella sulfatireligans]|uniref:NrS-1 polymerase-like helicase domain-containing protein n=1 Tax=Pontiella sulfatireligans TaxID=2750658 RepID=A0A6C2USW8_9BACT|nr:DUF5906 domain-containing protein [Pontiella sulfatireligans]VGO22317.1 hypothetical protein SCARR_04400 [Pontiella sulfatireligans]
MKKNPPDMDDEKSNRNNESAQSALTQALDEDVEASGHSTQLVAYYDVLKKEYLIKNSHGWITQTAAQFKRRLRRDGVSSKTSDGQMISPAEAEMLRIEDDHSVQYVGALAGYQEGFYETDGLRFLVSQSPCMVNPVKGDWEVLRKTFDAVLGDDAHDQRPFCFGWLQVAVKALRAGLFVPGQCLAIAGPAGSGKSLLQNLITVMLGGRSAKPYQFMTGGTAFNSELFQTEHLMIEDEAPASDYRSRRKLGTQIKQITVNETQRLHAKGREAVTVRVLWRLSITLNDEPEDLHVLPTIDSSLEDKLILLRAYKRTLPMPTDSQEQKKAFWDALMASVPAFLHWLIHDFVIPSELVSERFGVRHFHHPALVASLIEMSNETEFLALIDRYITLPFSGTASELDAKLREEARRQADALLYFNGAAGAYLARLSKMHPLRVRKRRSAKQNQWEISPQDDPPCDENQD